MVVMVWKSKYYSAYLLVFFSVFCSLSFLDCYEFYVAVGLRVVILSVGGRGIQRKFKTTLQCEKFEIFLHDKLHLRHSVL